VTFDSTSPIEHTALALGDVLLLAALASFIVFALTYTWITAWEDNPLGRHLMQSTLALVLLLSLPSGFEVFDAEFPGWQYARIAILLFLATIALRRTKMLLAAQRAARIKKREADRAAADHAGEDSTKEIS